MWDYSLRLIRSLCVLTAIGTSFSLWDPTSSYGKDFVFGIKTMPCEQAMKFRDTQLFQDFATIYDNYDAKKQERADATVKDFRLAVQEMAKKWDQADAAYKKKVGLAWAGVLIGKAAERVNIGIKANLTKQEDLAVKALKNRGAEWVTTFTQLGVAGETDVKGIVAMPMTFLLTISGLGAAEAVWSVGTAAMDTAFDLAEREIVKKEYNQTSTELIKRAEVIIRKSQAARIGEINRLKNAIDTQCNS